MINLWNQLYLLSLFSFFLLLSLPIHIQYPCILQYCIPDIYQNIKNDITKMTCDDAKLTWRTFVLPWNAQCDWLTGPACCVWLLLIGPSVTGRFQSEAEFGTKANTPVQSPHQYFLVFMIFEEWLRVWYLSECNDLILWV